MVCDCQIVSRFNLWYSEWLDDGRRKKNLLRKKGISSVFLSSSSPPPPHSFSWKNNIPVQSELCFSYNWTIAPIQRAIWHQIQSKMAEYIWQQVNHLLQTRLSTVSLAGVGTLSPADHQLGSRSGWPLWRIGTIWWPLVHLVSNNLVDSVQPVAESCLPLSKITICTNWHIDWGANDKCLGSDRKRPRSRRVLHSCIIPEFAFLL